MQKKDTSIVKNEWFIEINIYLFYAKRSHIHFQIEQSTLIRIPHTDEDPEGRHILIKTASGCKQGLLLMPDNSTYLLIAIRTTGVHHQVLGFVQFTYHHIVLEVER